MEVVGGRKSNGVCRSLHCGWSSFKFELPTVDSSSINGLPASLLLQSPPPSPASDLIWISCLNGGYSTATRVPAGVGDSHDRLPDRFGLTLKFPNRPRSTLCALPNATAHILLHNHVCLC